MKKNNFPLTHYLPTEESLQSCLKLKTVDINLSSNMTNNKLDVFIYIFCVGVGGQSDME